MFRVRLFPGTSNRPMGSPFLYSCDLWISDTRRHPGGRGTQRPLFYIAEPWSAAHRHPCRLDYLLKSAPPTRPHVVSIPIHFVGSDVDMEPAVPDAILKMRFPPSPKNSYFSPSPMCVSLKSPCFETICLKRQEGTKKLGKFVYY